MLQASLEREMVGASQGRHHRPMRALQRPWWLLAVMALACAPAVRSPTLAPDAGDDPPEETDPVADAAPSPRDRSAAPEAAPADQAAFPADRGADPGAEGGAPADGPADTAPPGACAIVAHGGPAPDPAKMIVAGLDGAVSAEEIASFKAFMATQPPATESMANNLSDGGTRGGKNAEALGLMFEISGDVAILNMLIKYAGTFLAARNDPATGEAMWTGNRELVWITKPPGIQRGYAGVEQGDIVGHIAYAAKLILTTPALWPRTVPDGDPFHHGATYLDRAKRFIAECEKTEDTYLVKYFIHPTTFVVQDPDSDAWRAMGEKNGPYNRQMFLMSGFQRLAEAHELLGDAPAKVALYDKIVKVAVEAFVADLRHTTCQGAPCYDWGYGHGLRGSENIPIHGSYDIWGTYRAFTRPTLGISRATMLPFANTLHNVIYQGSGMFSGNVDGTSGSVPVRNYIYPQWMLLAHFDPALYAITANANIASGWQANHAEFTAFILWIKQQRCLGHFPR
jgi:hypothetical protein